MRIWTNCYGWLGWFGRFVCRVGGTGHKASTLLDYVTIISDFIYKAIIFDVIVSTASRGNGLGQKLMSLVKSHEMLQKVKHFELYCLPEMEAFYSSFGFSTEVGGIKLMRCTNA